MVLSGRRASTRSRSGLLYPHENHPFVTLPSLNSLCKSAMVCLLTFVRLAIFRLFCLLQSDRRSIKANWRCRYRHESFEISYKLKRRQTFRSRSRQDCLLLAHMPQHCLLREKNPRREWNVIWFSWSLGALFSGTDRHRVPPSRVEAARPSSWLKAKQAETTMMWKFSRGKIKSPTTRANRRVRRHFSPCFMPHTSVG